MTRDTCGQTKAPMGHPKPGSTTPAVCYQLSDQTINQGDCIGWFGSIYVVYVPIRNPVFPARESFPEQQPVFRFFHCYNYVRTFKIINAASQR
jgi:hypothetical protein